MALNKLQYQKVATRFNLLIILFIIVPVLFSSVLITAYLFHRFTADTKTKDLLHIKGLAGTVKGWHGSKIANLG